MGGGEEQRGALHLSASFWRAAPNLSKGCFTLRRRPTSLRESLSPLLLEQDVLSARLQCNLDAMEQEAKRVAELMYSAPQVLEDLDRQFAETTRLNRTDIAFLFIATGLQCLRQYIFPSNAFRIDAEEGDNLVKKAIPKKWEDILTASVPYDAFARTPTFRETLGGTGLSGATHRYRTLGHDPLCGWVFGPVNIVTDSLTKSDVVTTYSVTNMKLSGLYPGSTPGAFHSCFDACSADKYILPVAILRQAIHFGSDYFTHLGLPIPVVGTISEDFATTLVSRFGVDMYSVMRSATLAMFINAVVSYVHALFYDEESGISPEIYAVRTRKIISYSNIIASTSNILYVSVSAYLGNTGALKKLDVGGLLVTIWRMVSDYRYVTQIKREFLKNRFHEMVMGSK
jgi:hypothetical protein